ncbi:DUF397 domain-containing protein [Streptomyces sp. NPDC050485]|uniref:DUF397 domain-containing protein n=1 Tax=Streptomyces sp. NPDC050485 TaxID=3365617 RepID=UPI0037BDCFEC
MNSSTPDLRTAVWRKSSYSNGEGGACVEIVDGLAVVPVRDSKMDDSPVLLLSHSAFAGLVELAREGA